MRLAEGVVTGGGEILGSGSLVGLLALLSGLGQH
jgi:hypothetical protein